MSRRDNKGLNDQDGEVLIPINKQSSDIESGVNVSKDDLDAGAGDQDSMFGYTRGIIDDCGPMHVETATASTK